MCVHDCESIYKFIGVLDLGLLLTLGVNAACPEEMVGRIELPVVELSVVDCSE